MRNSTVDRHIDRLWAAYKLGNHKVLDKSKEYGSLAGESELYGEADLEILLVSP